jgi:hypothetical protein
MDSLFEKASLKFNYFAISGQNAEIKFKITDPNGNTVSLPQSTFCLTSTNIPKPYFQQIDIPNPQKWDAEHPNLYTLWVAIIKNGKELYSFKKRFGIREITIVDNKLIVNGKPVKLRGACRHDMHPKLGRSTNNELDSLDANIFKQANMNFVRTSHYPPTEKFLDYCDQLGIYVECETAICFVDTHAQFNYLPRKTQNDTTYKANYLSQLEEMVISFRSHSSIIIWSIGNESDYGENFQESYDWIKQVDSIRPIIFSYPGLVPKNRKVYDILSMHYPDINGNINQYGINIQNFHVDNIPVLFDEWAHVPCYTYETLQNDPNIREFWGISLDKMWNEIFESQGGLGGAIWGYIDDTFTLPKFSNGNSWWKEYSKTSKPDQYQGDCVGYGEWGIVDVWRRFKPEFWATKKSYSPLRLLLKQVEDLNPGEKILLPVFNRFDHTNLNEIFCTYKYSGNEKKLALPDILPHEKGLIIIPPEEWTVGTQIEIKFYDRDMCLIDAYLLPIGVKKHYFSNSKTGELTTTDINGKVTVNGTEFSICFDKSSGLITGATSHGSLVIEKGPFLNLNTNNSILRGAEVRKSAGNFFINDSNWVLESFNIEYKDGHINVLTKGNYQSIKVELEMTVFETGRIEISYQTKGEPNTFISEAGLKFYLPPTFTKLMWERKGYWDYYPDDAFSGNYGVTSLFNSNSQIYGEYPNQSWGADTKDYYYYGNQGSQCGTPLTKRAKSMKENVYTYTLSSSVEDCKLSFVSADGNLACRVNQTLEGNLILYANNRWDYPEIAWGNYCKSIKASPNYGKIVLYL